MKEFKPDFINPEPQPIEKVTGLNKELEVKGIYLKQKVISQSISGTGDTLIKCGFPPRIVMASVQGSTEYSNGNTDFTTAFSIRIFNSAGVATSQSSNLINLSTITGNATKKYYNGFNLNISSFSGGAKTIYFTCIQ